MCLFNLILHVRGADGNLDAGVGAKSFIQVVLKLGTTWEAVRGGVTGLR